MRQFLIHLMLLFGALVAGYQLDAIVYNLKQYSAQTFDYWPGVWMAGTAPIVIAALAIAMIWLAFSRLPMSSASSLVYVLVGGAAAYFVAIDKMMPGLIMPFDIVPLMSTTSPYFGQIGAFSALIGLARLITSFSGRMGEPRTT